MDNIYDRGNPDMKAMIAALKAAGETLLDWQDDVQEEELCAYSNHPDRRRFYGIELVWQEDKTCLFRASKGVLRKHLRGWVSEDTGEATFLLFSDAVMWCELDGLADEENPVPDSSLEPRHKSDLMMNLYEIVPSATKNERERLSEWIDTFVTRLMGEAYVYGWKEGNTRAMPWIPVSEAMPKALPFSYEVLVYIPHLENSEQSRKPVAVATVPRYRKGPWLQIGSYKLEESQISHWMPMPPSPPRLNLPDPFLTQDG